MAHPLDGNPLSFGAGVNSVALAILLVTEGWQNQIIFADTGNEWPETYAYLAAFDAGWLRPRGHHVVTLHPKRDPVYYQSKARGYTLMERCLHERIVPFAHVRWCTAEWKSNPIDKYADVHGLGPRMLGMAADESRRATWAVRPLVDRLITRRGCKRIIHDAGLAVPPKSGCFFCPFQGENTWRLLWELHPDLFLQAMAMEEHSRCASTRKITPNGHGVLDAKAKTTVRERLARYQGQDRLI